MPNGYVCYDPPKYAAPVSVLPALERGFLTFGSFNNPTKITQRVIETWSRILNSVPDSRLILKYTSLGNVTVAKRIMDEFHMCGVAQPRIECLGGSPHPELLAKYQDTDLALDTFPYNGGLTTCEALWMGVPVITIPGETFAGRHSLSHLSNVGMMETIAADLDRYVELAISLATDLPRLATIRANLRNQMALSPLCDGKQFAFQWTKLMREVWHQYCLQPTTKCSY
jgi:protein O-GlcNAc transferase